MKVAPDVPQVLLDIFNKVDFGKVNKFLRGTLIKQIQSWVSSNIPMKSPSKHYKSSGGKKIIAHDFDKELLDILNAADYEMVNKATLDEAIVFLKKYIKILPQKK